MTDIPEGRPQLRALSEPFKGAAIQRKPGKFGADYVGHAMVVQKLLATLGPVDFFVDQVIREGSGPNEGMVVGCLASMSGTIDGASFLITEVGDVEYPENKANDGARLKDAASDAYKRCAMRIGAGLHLWAKDGYFLDRKLEPEVNIPDRELADDLVKEATAEPAEMSVPTQELADQVPEMTPEEAEAESRRKWEEAKAAPSAPEPEVETMGDLKTSPLAMLSELPGPKMAKAKRALEAAGHWPLHDDWDGYENAAQVAIMGIITEHTA